LKIKKPKILKTSFSGHLKWVCMDSLEYVGYIYVFIHLYGLRVYNVGYNFMYVFMYVLEQ